MGTAVVQAQKLNSRIVGSSNTEQCSDPGTQNRYATIRGTAGIRTLEISTGME